MTDGIDDESAKSPREATDLPARRLRRARRFQGFSLFLVFVSVLAVIACTRPEGARIVPYLMWNHVAIIAVFAFGTFSLNRLPKRSPGHAAPWPGVLFRWPVLVVAAVAAIAAVPGWTPLPEAMGHAPDGRPVTHHHWHASPDGAHYFENINGGPDQEITEARFEELDRRLYSVFARIWVVFSFAAFMMWRVVALGWTGRGSGQPALR